MDAVLAGRKNLFLIHLRCDDAVRNARWQHRKEEAGGRTRQLGESVAARDEEDAQLRTQPLRDRGEPGKAGARHRHHQPHGGRRGAADLGGLRSGVGHPGRHQQAGDGQGGGARHLARPDDGKGEPLHRQAAAVRRLHHRGEERQGHLRAQVGAGGKRIAASSRSGRRSPSTSWPTASAASRRSRCAPLPEARASAETRAGYVTIRP